MKDIRYLTDKKGEKIAAVVPIGTWRLLENTYDKLKKDNREEDTWDDADLPPLPAKGKSLIRVKNSPIHGRGVFATAAIKKGTAIVEYSGEHITHDTANERYGSRDNGHEHTFLFTIDNEMVIDASVGGNAAKYINHSCDPNCETVQYGQRVLVEAIRDIRKDEELTYDYHLQVEKPHTKKKLRRYACFCGSPKCRGTQVDTE